MYKCIAVLGGEFESVHSSLRATVLAVSFELLHTDGSYSIATLFTINRCLAWEKTLSFEYMQASKERFEIPTFLTIWLLARDYFLFSSQICMHLSNFIVSLWPQSIDSRLHCRYNWIYSGYEALDILSRKIFELSSACNIIPYQLPLVLFVTEMSYRC